MAYFVYILRSQTTRSLYKGSTGKLSKRLEQHAEGVSFFTLAGGPWELVHSEESPTRAVAVRRERFYKTGKGREELQRLLGAATSS